jgi:hypothetical protein
MCRGFRTNQLTFTNAHKILPPQLLLNVGSAWIPSGFVPKNTVNFERGALESEPIRNKEKLLGASL